LHVKRSVPVTVPLGVALASSYGIFPREFVESNGSSVLTEERASVLITMSTTPLDRVHVAFSGRATFGTVTIASPCAKPTPTILDPANNFALALNQGFFCLPPCHVDASTLSAYGPLIGTEAVALHSSSPLTKALLGWSIFSFSSMDCGVGVPPVEM